MQLAWIQDKLHSNSGIAPRSFFPYKHTGRWYGTAADEHLCTCRQVSVKSNSAANQLFNGLCPMCSAQPAGAVLLCRAAPHHHVAYCPLSTLPVKLIFEDERVRTANWEDALSLLISPGAGLRENKKPIHKMYGLISGGDRSLIEPLTDHLSYLRSMRVA